MMNKGCLSPYNLHTIHIIAMDGEVVSVRVPAAEVVSGSHVVFQVLIVKGRYRHSDQLHTHLHTYTPTHNLTVTPLLSATLSHACPWHFRTLLTHTDTEHTLSPLCAVCFHCVFWDSVRR